MCPQVRKTRSETHTYDCSMRLFRISWTAWGPLHPCHPGLVLNFISRERKGTTVIIPVCPFCPLGYEFGEHTEYFLSLYWSPGTITLDERMNQIRKPEVSAVGPAFTHWWCHTPSLPLRNILFMCSSSSVAAALGIHHLGVCRSSIFWEWIPLSYTHGTF